MIVIGLLFIGTGAAIAAGDPKFTGNDVKFKDDKRGWLFGRRG